MVFWFAEDIKVWLCLRRFIDDFNNIKTGYLHVGWSVWGTSCYGCTGDLGMEGCRSQLYLSLVWKM